MNPAAASTFVVAGYPSATTAGVAGTVSVTANDPYGNTTTGYTGTVHFTSSDAQAVLPADYTFTATDAGVHTFSATFKTAGSQSLTATDMVTSAISGARIGIAVSPAVASALVVSGYPSPITVGVTGAFTVTAHDAYGNTATGYTGTVTFSSTDSQAFLPANYAFTTTDAGVHIFIATFKATGTQSITATDTVNALITGTQSGITVSPLAAPVTYYVSPTGSDSNPGILSQPFATINHGVKVLKPGDTLYIRGGTYAETLNDTIPAALLGRLPLPWPRIPARPPSSSRLRPPAMPLSTSISNAM